VHYLQWLLHQKGIVLRYLSPIYFSSFHSF
jgi:hypothetical protein